MFQKKKGMEILFGLLVLVILAAALYVRIDNLGERSLWQDEAWVANAAIQPNLSLLIKRSLTAPLFFVLSIHYLSLLMGKSEFVLRLLPCLFGFGTLILFYLLIKRIAGKPASLLTLLMLSFSSPFIHYSRELKQYSGAMFFVLLLVYFCEEILKANKDRDWILLSLFCVLGVGLDHSILFIVPTVFVVLLLNLPFRENWKKIACSGIPVFTFSILFFSFHTLSQISNSIEAIQKFWLGGYPRLSSFSSFLGWFVTSFRRMFHFFGLPYFPVSLLIVLVGLTLFYKKSKKRFWLYIILPLALTITASFLKRYPFGGHRLMLFFAPLLYFAFGSGLNFIFEALRRSRLYFPLVCAAIILSGSPVSDFVQAVKHPLRREEIRPLLEKVRSHIQPDDKIYVYYGAKEAYEYYYKTRFYGMTETRNIIWGKPHRNDIPKYTADLEKHLRTAGRIWLIFSHTRENERALIVQFTEKKGRFIQKLQSPEAVAYLFRIQPSSGQAPRPDDPSE